MHRDDALQLAPTLFGIWALVAEWGRLGSPGTIQQKVFQAMAFAQAAMAKRQTVKSRRGYRPSPLPSA
jgi:predicted DNA-binding WGR domain protein